MKKVRILLNLFLLIFIFPNEIKASDLVDTYGNGEYAITEYLIDITVNEDNTFKINESIQAYFNVPKHGIFRKIPIKNEVVRLDGTKNYNIARISDVKSSIQFFPSFDSGYKVIKLGDPSTTITGSQKYDLSYIYDIGKDKSKNYDEFYFNLIGNDFDTTISNVSFKITMPKSFDKSKLGFSSGYSGITNSSNIEYTVDGNVITGKYNGVLLARQGLTTRLELPEGYFIRNYNFNTNTVILYIVPIICTLIIIAVWSKYGKDRKVIETVEFYPPEGFNSAELGFLYKGVTYNTDLTSLLIYLADKGYIKIVEHEEKVLFSSFKTFKIIKLKDYDGEKLIEKLFLNGLFKSKKSWKTSVNGLLTSIKDAFDETKVDNENEIISEVTASDLTNNFYITINEIAANLNSKENKEKIFEKSFLLRTITLNIMMIISILVVMAIPVLEYSGTYGLPSVLILTLLYSFFYSMIFLKGIPLLARLFILIFWLAHSIAFFSGTPLFESLLSNTIILIGFSIGIICVILMKICVVSMPKRTKYGSEILGRIKGFKNFLEQAEKEKLEQLVNENPSYFYNILPFTYVLGISDKWIKSFEKISINKPDWYDGSSSFDIGSFGTFINSTMNSASESTSSSSSSGGGSSGGGSGGGGGGSW